MYRRCTAAYISQPSLSQMIRKAEGRIGATIFDRSTSPIGLTEAGRAYVRAAEQVLQIESDLRRYLDDAERCITGVLTLGGAMLFTSYVLPPLLSAFSELNGPPGMAYIEKKVMALTMKMVKIARSTRFTTYFAIRSLLNSLGAACGNHAAHRLRQPAGRPSFLQTPLSAGREQVK